MKKKVSLLSLSALTLALVSTSTLAYQSFDARSYGMGGIGVSTADYLTAPFHNPALAARYKSSVNPSGAKSYGFLFPSIGIQVYDKDDLYNRGQDFADLYDDSQSIVDRSVANLSVLAQTNDVSRADALSIASEVQEQIALAGQTLNTVSLTDLATYIDNSPTASGLGITGSSFNGDADAILKQAQLVLDSLATFEGNKGYAQVGAGLVIAIPTNYVSVNFSVKAYADALAYIDINRNDLTLPNIIQALEDEDNTFLESQLALWGVSIQEFGFTFAKDFQLNNGTLYVGITPKYQRVDTINYVASMSNYEFSDYKDDDYHNKNNQFNIDFGVAYDFNLSNYTVTLGLAAKNLLSKEFQLTTVQGSQIGTTGEFREVTGAYKLSPLVTASASISNDQFTVGFDVDLNQNERFTSISGLNNPLDAKADNTQMANIGVEYHGLGWVKLRTGYQYDLQRHLGNQFTAGVGFTILKRANIDFSGSYGGKNQLGAGVQLSFNF